MSHLAESLGNDGETNHKPAQIVKNWIWNCPFRSFQLPYEWQFVLGALTPGRSPGIRCLAIPFFSLSLSLSSALLSCRCKTKAENTSRDIPLYSSIGGAHVVHVLYFLSRVIPQTGFLDLNTTHTSAWIILYSGVGGSPVHGRVLRAIPAPPHLWNASWSMMTVVMLLNCPQMLPNVPWKENLPLGCESPP